MLTPQQCRLILIKIWRGSIVLTDYVLGSLDSWNWCQGKGYLFSLLIDWLCMADCRRLGMVLINTWPTDKGGVGSYPGMEARVCSRRCRQNYGVWTDQFSDTITQFVDIYKLLACCAAHMYILCLVCLLLIEVLCFFLNKTVFKPITHFVDGYPRWDNAGAEIKDPAPSPPWDLRTVKGFLSFSLCLE